jgi:VWFA-related protein
MRFRNTRKPLLVTTFATLLTVLAWPAAAQDSRTAPGVFGEVIEVRVVNLELVVTDKKGNRITGLKHEDFQLEVDGKEVPVEYFTEIFSGRAVERPSDAPVSSVPQLAPGEAVSTSYLVFVDEFFSREAERDRVVRHMIEQLPHLAPEDRLAVVAFDGKGLEMLSSWTQSQSAMADVLRRTQARPAYGAQWQATLRTYEFNREHGADVAFQQGRNPDLATELTQNEEQAVMEVTHQVERVVLAAVSALRSFANPPGRKVMLLLSGGWPYDPVGFISQNRSRVGLDQPYSSGAELYRPLIETANRLSYTLYTVDTPGLMAEGNQGSSLTGDAALIQGNERFRRQFELDSSLTQLAVRTGGRAFLNGRETDALAEVVADTRTYYWLGFTPSWKGNDENHDIRVKMRRPGLEVRTRKSYSDLSRRAEVTMMVESSLLFGNPPSEEPLLTRVGKARKSGFGRVTVPLSVIIPVSALTFLPHEKGYVAQTELRVAVLDENGNTADVPVIQLPLLLDEPPVKGQLQRFDTEVRMRKQEHDVVVSLYDTTSGKILSARLEVDPG